MKDSINPIDYEKITDDVYYLGGGIYLRLNVILAKKTKDGNRRHFVSNYKYASKYVDKGKVITMRRSFDYYLTLDNKFDSTHNVMIRVQNMILFKSKIKEATKWFSDSNVFGIRKNRLVILKRETISITDLPAGKFIKLEPVVIDYDDNTQKPGIRVTLSDSNVFSDMSIENFYGLVYLVDTFNMYQSSQLLVASIGVIEEPRTVDFEEEPEDDFIPETKATEGRKPRGMRKSFFDQ